MSTKPDITLLGCGVSGLTTSIVLLEAGYSVQVITKELPKDTVSAVAGAIWFPYEARPFEKVTQWSLESFNTFRKLAQDSNAGISMIDYAIILEEPYSPWWLDSIPEGHIISDSVTDFYNKPYPGYIVNVPLIETQVYLPWLLDRFHSLGGEIIRKEIHSTKELEPFELIINCTALGSKNLFGDEDLFPIQGQVAKVNPDKQVKGMATDFHFGDSGEEMAYIIPRRDGIIIGGTARPNIEHKTPEPELTQKLIRYNAAYEPQIEKLLVLEQKTGLRPGRSEIRLEKDSVLPVIHNYGHGGAGYTVSWGCAGSVLKLVDSF